ncbi:MAG: toll/interleukin-1 receptor domain-containing protein, partial [Pricia sp.]|nr:toll/interleukin-1 receptor domain-containing protein [Pricia sp.]
MSFAGIFNKKTRPKIFICYRRGGEGAGFGGRIADKLVKHFGDEQCFRDIEDIEKGTDFVESLKHATSICELLLVVIGPDWVTMKGADGKPRIEDHHDFVRLEVSTALERNIRVIPVLVGGAKVPSEDQLPDDLKGLHRRQAHELTDQRWHYDSDELIRAIESMGIKGMSPEEKEARKRKKKVLTAVAVTALIILISVGVGFSLKNANGEITKKEPVKNEFIDTSDTRNVKNLDIPVPEPVVDYSREEGSVKNALMLGSNLEIEALRTLNENPLSKVFIGDALRNAKATLDQFRNLGVHQISNLEYQSFGDITVYKEGNRLLAEAELDETWSSHTHRNSDNLCLVHQEPHDAPQTVFLERKNDSWYISAVTHHNT